MIFFEAERAGHAATAGVEQLKIELHLFQQLLFSVEFHDGFVMAVPVDDRLAVQLGRLVMVSVLF